MAVKLGIIVQQLRGLKYALGVLLPLILGILSFDAKAARDAIVIQDKAVIWADAQRSAPLGYARRGRILRVGNKDREKGQVVPVVVSGRIGYVAVDDLSFEDDVRKQYTDENTASRYKEATKKRFGEYFTMGYTRFSAAESKDEKAGRPGDDWTFNGGFLKGELFLDNSWVGLSFMLEYLYAGQGDESFRMFEMGMGGSVAIVNFRRVKIKAEAMGLLVPWAQYESRPLFTLNGYGLGALGQGTAQIFISESVGLDVSLGIQAVKVFKIKRPAPFKEFSPLFTGPRAAAALVIRF